MITKELVEYVRNQHALGKTETEIRQNLIAGGGWSSSDLDEVFSKSKRRLGKAFYIISLLIILAVGAGVFAYYPWGQVMVPSNPSTPPVVTTSNQMTSTTTAGSPVSSPLQEKGDLVVLIQDSLADALSQELATYASDVKRELGWNVVQKRVVLADDVFSLKSFVKDYYATKPLRGVLVVGDVPTGQFYDPNQLAGSVFDSQGYFLSDSIYQDLLDACIYSPKLKAFDYTKNNMQCASGVTVNPYWVARLTPNSTTQSSLSLLKSYFARNHAFRTGQISFLKDFIGYLPIVASMGPSDRTRTAEDFAAAMSIYGTYSSPTTAKVLFDDADRADQEYLSALAEPGGHEAVLFNGHGLPTFHQHNITPSSIASANFVFLNLLSCSVGRFTTPDYLGGKYLFSGGLLELSATTPVFASSVFDRDEYETLSEGVPLYKVFDYTGVGDNILGDPTLRLRYDGISTSQARATITTGDLSFSEAASDQIITITNTGTEPLLFNVRGKYLTQKEGSKLTSFTFGQGANIITGDKKADMIMPGKTGTLTISSTNFFPYDSLPPGDYKAKLFILSNDNTNPFVEINLDFKV